MSTPRRRPRRRVRWLLLPVALLAAFACGRGGRGSFDDAVDRIFAAGFPQELETFFCSQGTNPDLGFRWAGTPAERAVSERVAAEMSAMGLANVRLEPVPVDVFEFAGASLAVGGRSLTASTFAGVPPTPAAGVAGPLVYAKGGTASDLDAAGDVAGKIVLLDLRLSSWWILLPALEAGRRGAAGIVCAYTPEDPKYFSADPAALGSFDGQYAMDAPPWICVSRADGDWLKAQLAAGPVSATLVLDERVRRAEDGGQGYNVVGEIPGTRRDGQIILLAAHEDAHFRAGADDTGALVNLLAIAKAMKTSGLRPGSTIVFLATSGEEFGHTDAYYEWCIGAWWAATRTHPDWAGKVRTLINLETMALAEAPLTLRSTPELRPWLEALTARSKDLLAFGAEVITPVNSWNDQWTFTAAGVPSFKINVQTDAYDTVYHSNLETRDLVDFGHLAKIAKWIFRAVEDLDAGLLPISLGARAAEIAAAWKTDDVGGAGADPAVAARLDRAVGAFERAAAAFEAAKPAVPAARIGEVNAGLLAVEKTLNAALTGLSPADDDATVFPYQSVLRDLRGVDAALAALRASPPDLEAALKALRGVYLTRLGIAFSHPVYERYIGRLDPQAESLAWGAQGRLPAPLDVVPEFRLVEAGEAAGAAAGLRPKREALAAELDGGLGAMAEALERAAAATAGLAGQASDPNR
jgi:hypothetical protein